MLDVLKDTLFYIEQQHDWLAYIQSVIDEKEQKYKLLHTKITRLITEESNKQELVEFDTFKVVKQECADADTVPTYHDNQEDAEISNETFPHDAVEDPNVNEESLEEFENATSIVQLRDESHEFDSIFHKRFNETNHPFLVHKPVNFYDEVNSVSKLDISQTSCNLASQEFEIIDNNIDNTLAAHYPDERRTNICKEPTQNSLIKSVGFRRNTSSEIATLKPNKCSYCSKSFAHNGDLVKHKRIHTGERPFKCTFCSKTFVQRVHLRQHERIHTGEKPFKCTFCNQSFRVKQLMQIHLRRHTDEKPFVCSICGKSYNEKYGLTIHLRTHTFEKPYSCPHCGKLYKDKRSLNKHLETHITIDWTPT